MTDFEWALSITAAVEGGLSLNPDDPGNWTGGKRGAGELKGTKYGISAAAHPDLDIRALTREQARDIFEKEYWLKLGCDKMHRRLAALVFDSAVQHGPEKAAEWLHTPLEVESYLGRRLSYYATLDDFHLFGAGWMARMGRVTAALVGRPDRAETMVFDGSLFDRLALAFSGRIDGGVAYRTRPLVSGAGGKINLRRA